MLDILRNRGVNAKPRKDKMKLTDNMLSNMASGICANKNSETCNSCCRRCLFNSKLVPNAEFEQWLLAELKERSGEK